MTENRARMRRTGRKKGARERAGRAGYRSGTGAVKAMRRDRDKNREMQQKVWEEGWQKEGWRGREET